MIEMHIFKFSFGRVIDGRPSSMNYSVQSAEVSKIKAPKFPELRSLRVSKFERFEVSKLVARDI